MLRIVMLAGEIDANQEENRMYQEEITALYERLDDLPRYGGMSYISKESSWAATVKKACPKCNHGKGFRCQQCWPVQSLPK